MQSVGRSTPLDTRGRCTTRPIEGVGPEAEHAKPVHAARGATGAAAKHSESCCGRRSALTRIVIADGAAVFRAGASSILQDSGSFEVLQARDRAALDDVVARHAPEVALLAIDLPPDGGLGALDALVLRGTRVVMWGSYPSAETVVDAI